MGRFTYESESENAVEGIELGVWRERGLGVENVDRMSQGCWAHYGGWGLMPSAACSESHSHWFTRQTELKA